MGWIYLIWPAVLWAVWAIVTFAIGAPWWVEWPLGLVAAGTTGAALVLAGLTSVGPRF